MGVPRQRKTKSATKQVRSHHALTRIQFARCQNCGAATMPHDVCGTCGFYKGREVLKKSIVKAK